MLGGAPEAEGLLWVESGRHLAQVALVQARFPPCCRKFGGLLHAYVNGERVATAVDSDLPTGRYGIGTYRTAASFSSIGATQP